MRKIIFTLALLLIGGFTFGQSVYDLRINELLIKNVDNFEDDYGHREQWVELYNAGHAKVDIGGCYLSVKMGDSKQTYRIPTGDPRTVIAPLSYIVFFCEGTDTKGTFHTNFTLDQTGYLALLNASGKGKPIDEVTYSVNDQEDDISIGEITNQEGELVFIKLPATTPNATNELAEEVPQHERFRRMDPSGTVMIITAMIVVFAALVALWLLFSLIGNTMVRIAHRKDAKSKGIETPVKTTKDSMYSGEVVAAIGMAMQLYEDDLHDKESTILTINKVAKAYSPWSSKIYGLRQIPNKK